MSRSAIHRTGLLLAALSLAATVVACGDRDAQAPAAAAPAVSSAPIAPASPATDDQVQRPARHDLSCVDRTGSVPPWFTQRSLRHVAGRIANAVTGPMQPAVFYLRSMSANSYAPEAEIATVELSAVPPAPRPPDLSSNPFSRKENSERKAVYERELTAWRGGLEATRAFAEASAARIRSQTLPVDDTGTDVFGCLLRASDLLGTDGERSLFIASDLIAAGRQQNDAPAPGSLSGVHVTVTVYCADLASTCARRASAFTDTLRRAGAGDVALIDPQNLTE
jgi:hypothetical protein